MLIHLLVLLIVYGVVFAILWWAISQIPLPAPFGIAVRVIFALVAALLVIQLILPVADSGVGCGRLICP